MWKNSTPSEVKSLVSSSVKWLESNILQKKYKKQNAFFSGSVKGYSDLPFWYPANYLKMLNGSDIDKNNASPTYLENGIIGISGTNESNNYFD